MKHTKDLPSLDIEQHQNKRVAAHDIAWAKWSAGYKVRRDKMFAQLIDEGKGEVGT